MQMLRTQTNIERVKREIPPRGECEGTEEPGLDKKNSLETAYSKNSHHYVNHHQTVRPNGLKFYGSLRLFSIYFCLNKIRALNSSFKGQRTAELEQFYHKYLFTVTPTHILYVTHNDNWKYFNK